MSGLGNPGGEYDRTRHNVGFEAINYLSALYRIPTTKAKFKALVGEGIIQGEKVLGETANIYEQQRRVDKRSLGFKLEPQKLIVIYDALIWKPVQSVFECRGAGTHNGMRSFCITWHRKVSTNCIGVADQPHYDLVSYVLESQSDDESISEQLKIYQGSWRIMVAELNSYGKYNDAKEYLQNNMERTMNNQRWEKWKKYENTNRCGKRVLYRHRGLADTRASSVHDTKPSKSYICSCK